MTTQTQSNSKANSPLSIRLSDTERATLLKAANGTALSVYARKKLFGDATTLRQNRTRDPIASETHLAQILAWFGRSDLGASLKSLAEDARDGALLLDDETVASIHRACADIGEIRSLLLQALGLKEGGTE